MNAKRILKKIYAVDNNYYQYFRVLRFLMNHRVLDTLDMARHLHAKHTKMIAYSSTLMRQGLIENTRRAGQGVDTIGINRIEHHLSSYVDEDNLVAKPEFATEVTKLMTLQLKHPEVDYLYKYASNNLRARTDKIDSEIRGLSAVRSYFLMLFFLNNHPKEEPIHLKYYGVPELRLNDAIHIMHIFRQQYLLKPSATENVYQPSKINRQRVRSEVNQILSLAPTGRMPLQDMHEIIVQQLFVQKH